jgi:hypothetical protein
MIRNSCTARWFGALVGVFLFALDGAAQTFTWNVDAVGSWGTATNWTSATVPNSTAHTADFGSVITANRTITVDGAYTLGSLSFTNAAFSYTISTTVASNVLTLDNGGAGATTITVNAGTTANQIINAPLTVADPQGLTITNLSSNTLSINTAGSQTLNYGATGLNLTGTGNITIGNGTNNSLSGSGAVTVSGAGVKTISGNNATFTGLINVAADGTLAIASANAVSAINAPNAITLNGGRLQYTTTQIILTPVPEPVGPVLLTALLGWGWHRRRTHTHPTR